MFFDRSWIVPRATARIIVKHPDDQRYEIIIKMRRLMPPEQLKTPKHSYVVWMDAGKDGIKNIGQLKVTSEDRRDVLRAETPFRPEKIFITAEDNADIQTPVGQVVLTTK